MASWCIPFTHRWKPVEITGKSVLFECRDCHKKKLRVKSWG